MKYRRSTAGDSENVSQDRTSHPIARSASGWAVLAFGGLVVGQRLSVPGLPIALTLPAMAIWMAIGVRRGLIELNLARLRLWLLAAGSTCVVVLIQTAVVGTPIVSITAWGLLAATWLPFICQLRDRRLESYSSALAGFVKIGCGLSVLSVMFMFLQFVGWKYFDLLAAVVPSGFLLSSYNTSYPIVYGSEIYKSNAFIGLEPSMVSLQLGLCLLAAIMLSNFKSAAVLAAGMACTFSGSGILLACTGVALMLLWPRRRNLIRLLPILLIVVPLVVFSDVGREFAGRALELSDDRSSASLRSTQAYIELWPRWSSRIVNILFGVGPGSSQTLLDGTAITGLLSPTPVKIFFEYGIIAGGLLAAFIIYCYADGPSPVFAGTLIVSLWTLQPGTTVFVLVGQVLLFVALWAPRQGHRIEELCQSGRCRDG
jgi:hypothetical protein